MSNSFLNKIYYESFCWINICCVFPKVGLTQPSKELFRPNLSTFYLHVSLYQTRQIVYDWWPHHFKILFYANETTEMYLMIFLRRNLSGNWVILIISGQNLEEEEVTITSISHSTACNCLLHCRLNKHFDRSHTGHGSCSGLPVVCHVGCLDLQCSSHLSRVLQRKNKRKYKQTNKRFVT